MNQENLDKIKKIISIVLLIGWCLLIFYFSNQAGFISRNSSSNFINMINYLFKVDLYKFKYSVFIVRKLAHMFLYFMLFIFTYNTFKSFKLKNVFLSSFIFCLIYSISDEVHQLFIFERSFGIIDILIDMLGAIISLIICKLILKFKNILK